RLARSMCVAGAGRRSESAEGIVGSVQLRVRRAGSQMLHGSVVRPHVNLKLAPNIALRGNGMHKRARSGIRRVNQLGSRLSCIRRKFNHCSHTRPPQLSRNKSAYRAGTRGASVKGTAPIRGTGRHWANWWALLRSTPKELNVLGLFGLEANKQHQAK